MTIAGVHESDLAEFTDLIKDEINVKEVAFADDVLAVANKFLYLKTPLIGKRLGAFMKDILAASKTDAWHVQDDGTLSIAGQTLNADEFELRLVLKESLKGLALPDNTAVVQLDTQVYPELEKEGIARDFVRMVQNLRKEKNLDVSDRIVLSYEASTDLINQALELHKNYIMEQVLALNIISNQALDNAPVSEEIGDGNVKVDLEKA